MKVSTKGLDEEFKRAVEVIRAIKTKLENRHYRTADGSATEAYALAATYLEELAGGPDGD